MEPDESRGSRPVLGEREGENPSRHSPFFPTQGTWESQDPDGYINGVNRYQFTGSDPIDRGDPSGFDWDWWDDPQNEKALQDLMNAPSIPKGAAALVLIAEFAELERMTEQAVECKNTTISESQRWYSLDKQIAQMNTKLKQQRESGMVTGQ